MSKRNPTQETPMTTSSQADYIAQMQARKTAAEKAMTPVHLGKSPADSTWVCYAQQSDTPETFKARVAKMRSRLAALWAKKVRTVKLTRGQMNWLDATIACHLPTQDDPNGDCQLSDKYHLGATVVRGSVDDLDILSQMVGNMLDSEDYVGELSDAAPEHLWYINEQRAIRCLRDLMSKLSRRTNERTA